MKPQERWSDDGAKWLHQRASVLLDRERRDLLARISIDSIESFSWHYKDCQRSQELENRLRPEIKPGDFLSDGAVFWADDILLLSASGQGWRAEAVERVQRGGHDEDEETAADTSTMSRGLRNHE